jgi:hypothetical protein
MFIYTAIAARDANPLHVLLAAALGILAAMIITGSIFRLGRRNEL